MISILQYVYLSTTAINLMSLFLSAKEQKVIKNYFSLSLQVLHKQYFVTPAIHYVHF